MFLSVPMCKLLGVRYTEALIMFKGTASTFVTTRGSLYRECFTNISMDVHPRTEQAFTKTSRLLYMDTL